MAMALTAKQLHNYVCICAAKMRLQNWEFTVDTDLQDGDFLFEITPQYPVMHAVVRVGKGLCNLSAEELRRCICHELLHIWINEPYEINRLDLFNSRQLAESTYALMMCTIQRNIEVSVHNISCILAEVLPLIEVSDERKR